MPINITSNKRISLDQYLMEDIVCNRFIAIAMLPESPSPWSPHLYNTMYI